MQEKRKAGSTSTGEVPPASCIPKNRRVYFPRAEG